MSQQRSEHRDLKWLHSPFVDLALIGYSWLPLYLVYAALTLAYPGFACDVHTQRSCPTIMAALITLTLFINRLHRHYSLGFAYGDREEFNRHRTLYTWAPVITFVLVIPCALYRTIQPGILRSVLFAIYAFMIALSGVWQVYHTVMQKFGFLRIYSAKVHHGDSRIEKHLFFSWLALVVIGSSYYYAGQARELIIKGPREILFLFNYARFLRPLSLVLLAPSVIYASVVTKSWIRTEYRSFSPASVPKLLFALSVALIMASFFHSLLIGVLLLGFSHAFEYLVFVNIFATRKYEPAPRKSPFFDLWTGHLVLCNVALAGLVYALTVFFSLNWVRPWGVLVAYAVFTSTLHFIYDGFLWKVSKPDVRAVLLELRGA